MGALFKISGKLSPLFRQHRMRKFLQLFEPDSKMHILDLGGLPRFWEGIPISSRITILNTHPLNDFERSYLQPNQSFVVGDGTRLNYGDKEFDLVFSNSVIEHLGSLENQEAFAAECRRVGKGYWVQTPAKEFVVEPHFFTLFIHWLPRSAQKRLLKNLSLWGWIYRPSPESIDIVLSELRLLRRKEFKQMFPECQIWTERFCGIPKSYTAYKIL
jgi:hypothetical protein